MCWPLPTCSTTSGDLQHTTNPKNCKLFPTPAKVSQSTIRAKFHDKYKKNNYKKIIRSIDALRTALQQALSRGPCNVVQAKPAHLRPNDGLRPPIDFKAV